MRLAFLLSIALLTLLSPVRAQTLDETLAQVISEGHELLEMAGGRTLTWSQSEAAKDLQLILQEARVVSQKIATSDPTDIKPEVEALATARRRLSLSSATLSMSSLAADRLERLLAKLDAFDERVRQLRMRFNGQAQPRGREFARQNLQGSSRLPHYDHPSGLRREAWSISRSAGSLDGLWLPGNWFQPYATVDLDDLHQMRARAQDFERATVGFSDVEETREAYAQLKKAYERVELIVHRSSSGRQLERSMKRLEEFYSAL